MVKFVIEGTAYSFVGEERFRGGVEYESEGLSIPLEKLRAIPGFRLLEKEAKLEQKLVVEKIVVPTINISENLVKKKK